MCGNIRPRNPYTVHSRVAHSVAAGHVFCNRQLSVDDSKYSFTLTADWNALI